MSTPDTPPSTRGAARHTGKIARRYEGDIPGGRAVQPHAQRKEDWRRRKIERMKWESRFTEKIGE